MRAGEKFPCAVLLAILGGRTAVSEEKYQRPSPVLRRRRLVSRNSEAGTKRTGSLRIVRRMANRAVMGNSVGGRKPDAVRLGRLSVKCVEKTLLQKRGARNRFDCLGGTVDGRQGAGARGRVPNGRTVIGLSCTKARRHTRISCINGGVYIRISCFIVRIRFRFILRRRMNGKKNGMIERKGGAMLAESERLLGFSMSVGTGNVPCPELFRREGASSCAVLRGAPLGRFLAGNETVRPFGRGKREKK